MSQRPTGACRVGGSGSQAVSTSPDRTRLTDDLTSVAIRVEEKQVPLARQELEIGSDLKQLRQVREFVRAFCRNLPGPPLDEDSVAALELAVNEAASNIMKHAYHGREDQWIHLEGRSVPGPSRSSCITSEMLLTPPRCHRRRSMARASLDSALISSPGASMKSGTIAMNTAETALLW